MVGCKVDIAPTCVCPILSLTATQFSVVLRVTLLCGTLLSMRMAAPLRLFCSLTLCVCQVYPGSESLIRIPKVWFPGLQPISELFGEFHL